MIKYIQLPFLFDVQKLQQETNSLLTKKWSLHYNTLEYKGNWSALPLRSVNGDANNILALDANNHFEDTHWMNEVPYIKEIIDQLQCPKMSVRLLNLTSGAEVHAHSDRDLYYEQGEVRLHIPIFTNELVEFYLEEERMHMCEGECWYLNLAMMHRLHNKSNTDRIHLVIDCCVNDWVINLFNSPSITIKKEVSNFPEKQRDTLSQLNTIKQLREMNTHTSIRLADSLEKELQDSNK